MVSLTNRNAEVQFGSDPSIFVALDRVHPCPKEVDDNDSWSGYQKDRKRARNNVFRINPRKRKLLLSAEEAPLPV